MKDVNKLIKQRIKRMFMNRNRRNEAKRIYITTHASKTGLHVSVYNLTGYIEKLGLKPPYKFAISPINYDKLWRQQIAPYQHP